MNGAIGIRNNGGSMNLSEYGVHRIAMAFGSFFPPNYGYLYN